MNPHSPEPLEQTRQRVVNELSKAYADSLITDASLEDRLMAAYEAASIEELDEVLHAIPGYTPPPVPTPRPASQHHYPPRARHRRRARVPLLPILIVAFVLFNAGAFLWPLFLIPFFVFGGFGRGCGGRRHLAHHSPRHELQ